MIIEQVQDDKTAQLLAKANLFRIRRQWDEAVTCCMQVLYYSPDSWSAHALIGDIYSDQDRPEEAIQWYCMTLDIRPDAQSVRDKLSKVVNSRRRQIVHAIDPTRPYMTRDGRTFKAGKFGKLAWYWSAPERKRLLIVAGMVIVVVAAVLAPSLLANRGNQDASASQFTQGPSPTSTNLVLQPVATPVKITPQPASMQPAAPQATTPTTGQLAPTLSPVVSTPTTPVQPVRDPNDLSILQALTADTALQGQGIEVVEAQALPSDDSLTVTFVSTGVPAPTQQAREMRDAMYVARSAFATAPAAQAEECTVRCLAATTGQSQQQGSQTATATPPALAFTGSVSRSSLSTEGGDLNTIQPGQLPGYFTDVWWAQSAPQAS